MNRSKCRSQEKSVDQLRKEIDILREEKDIHFSDQVKDLRREIEKLKSQVKQNTKENTAHEKLVKPNTQMEERSKSLKNLNLQLEKKSAKPPKDNRTDHRAIIEKNENHRIINHCSVKNANDRWQSSSDFFDDCSGIVMTSDMLGTPQLNWSSCRSSTQPTTINSRTSTKCNLSAYWNNESSNATSI
jgi:hypothetical protein